jgi:hypothetical protein
MPSSKNATETWIEINVAHGVRREKRIATAIQDFHARLRKHRMRALCISLAWLLAIAAVLNPAASRALYERRPWAEGLLAILLVLHLLWMVQTLNLGRAWLTYLRFKELSKDSLN